MANREDLGTRFSCFGWPLKMADHFTHFKSKLKIYQEHQEDNSTDGICYLKNICRTEKPFISYNLANKLALSKMNLTSMEVSMFKLVF